MASPWGLCTKKPWPSYPSRPLRGEDRTITASAIKAESRPASEEMLQQGLRMLEHRVADLAGDLRFEVAGDAAEIEALAIGGLQ